MKKPSPAASAMLFQAFILLVGAAALAFLLGEPHLEGRNAHATLFQIYFTDAFLAYAYAASIPFFVALHRAFRVSGHVARGTASSPESLQALKTIKTCGMLLIAAVALGEAFLLMHEQRRALEAV